MEAIIEDEVTSRFLAEELSTWNMLTRTGGFNTNNFTSWKLTTVYLLGLAFRSVTFHSPR